MNYSDVIGEGSYGCIHKPSLKCKKKNVNYVNKISKVAFTGDATKELKEYEKMSNIDKNNKYYLGKPIQCEFDETLQSNVISLNKCSNEQFILPEKIKQLSLIIMNDGGMDVSKFTNELDKVNVTNRTTEIVELFLIEFHRIFMGLKIMIEHNIIHHDLKPQNIIYDVDKNRINLIDFGLMTDKKTIIDHSKNSKYHFSVNHWSFPLETKFYNKNKYLDFCNKTKEQKDKYYNDMIVSVFDKTKRDDKTDALRTFFSFIGAKSRKDRIIDMYFKELYETYNNEYTKEHYDLFLNNSIDTLDIYGTGIALLYFYDIASKFFSTSLKNDLYDLFYQMVRPNFNKRIKIDKLIEDYETILENHDILKKYNKKFVNNVLVSGLSIPKYIENNIQKIHGNEIKLSKKEMIIKTLNPIIVECPPNKEYNPYTKRCVKKCEKGKSRDKLFNCVKECPPDKVLNVKTKRCIKMKKSKSLKIYSHKKECPPDKVLNLKTNRCINVKTLRECPRNKVYNEITKRCIKECNLGYNHNEKFKCVKICPSNKIFNPITKRCMKIQKQKNKTQKNKITDYFTPLRNKTTK
jgi:serine/threonine protein kinase